MLSLLIALFFGVTYGQSEAFSQYTPVVGGTHTQPGCVAIAMAHVMAHHSFPSQGRGAVEYSTATHHIAISDDLSRYPFSWEVLREPQTASDTTAISRLLYAAGIASHTDYCIDNSTASTAAMLSAMVENFSYDPDISLHSRECYHRHFWHALLFRELDAGRHVIMQATDDTFGSHAFVIDRYDVSCGDTLYHVNWGWEGKYNGLYDIDDLSPGEYHFITDCKAVIMCQPDDGIQSQREYLECRVNIDNTTPLTGEKGITGNVEVVNRAYRNFKGSYTVYLEDTSGKRRKIASKVYTGDLKTNHSSRNTFSFTAPDVPGEYSVVLEASHYAEYKYFTLSAFGDTLLTVSETSGITLPVCYDKLPCYDISGRRIPSNGNEQRRKSGSIAIRGGKKYF